LIIAELYKNCDFVYSGLLDDLKKGGLYNETFVTPSEKRQYTILASKGEWHISPTCLILFSKYKLTLKDYFI